MKALNTERSRFMISGIIMIILGIIALRHTVISSLVSIVMLGIILTAGGIVEIVRSFHSQTATKTFYRFALGLLYAGAGLFMLAKPGINAMSLTLVLSALLIASGIVRIVDSIMHKTDYRFWRIINGIISIIIGIMIWMQWPYSGLWFIGLVIGIELMVTGFTSLAIALIA